MNCMPTWGRDWQCLGGTPRPHTTQGTETWTCQAAFPWNTLISTRIAFPGTLSCQLAGTPTQLASAAGAPPSSWHSPYISSALSAQVITDTSLSEPQRHWPSHSSSPASDRWHVPAFSPGLDESSQAEAWIYGWVPAVSVEQWAAVDAVSSLAFSLARLSPTSTQGPGRTSPGIRRHPAGSRLITPQHASHSPHLASLRYVMAIGLFPLWRH